MEKVNLSVCRLTRQIKILMRQSLRISEDLECAHKRITVLEEELQAHNLRSQCKQEIYEMKILQHVEPQGA
nr:MAG TPA: hypothetical protein [Caudoviricetes sp.]